MCVCAADGLPWVKVAIISISIIIITHIWQYPANPFPERVVQESRQRSGGSFTIPGVCSGLSLSVFQSIWTTRIARCATVIYSILRGLRGDFCCTMFCAMSAAPGCRDCFERTLEYCRWRRKLIDPFVTCGYVPVRHGSSSLTCLNVAREKER